MKRFTGTLALASLLLIACTETTPTANSVESPALSETGETSCPTCVFGPRKFGWEQGERIRTMFIVEPAPIGNCTIRVEDDGEPATTARVWYRGRIVVDYSALLGAKRVVEVPVVVMRGSNALDVSVRGGAGHSVNVRVMCADGIAISPSQVTQTIGAAQQFSVSGVPGPYTWSVNGIDGGNSGFGTVDAQGLYLAPAAVPTPATFPVCVRVTATPAITACATVTIAGPPAPRIQISSGDGQAARPGSPVRLAPTVLVTRADGSPWPGVAVTFAVAGGGGTVAGATQTTDANGIATVGNWTLGTALGPNTLTATAAATGVAGNPVSFSALGMEIRTFSAWGQHSCGIATDGTTYCWGENNRGQLGDGTATDRHQPTAVVGAPTFASLTAGFFFNCGLTADGSAFCWGSDVLLGFPWTPVPVGGALKFVSLSAGSYNICGLATDGTAYCWGSNGAGQLGDGTMYTRATPTAVTGGLTFVNLLSSESHTCGLTLQGEAYCWGSNDWGELGDSSTTGRLVPTRVATMQRFASLAVGKMHTCGLTSMGEAFCWGLNVAGAVGDGTGINRPAPTRVSGGLMFTALTAGAVHTCGLTTGGAAYCWGQATKGELGIGPAPNFVYMPTAVAGGLLFQNLVAGWEHTCGLTGGGMLYCWGDNDNGQLGDGTTTTRWVPTGVIGGLQFLAEGP